MNIKPLLSRVVIEQDSADETTSSGLIIPDSAKEKPLSGKIVAKGEKANLVEIGDNVMYNKNFGTEIYIKGIPYMIMNQENILAVI